MRATPHKTTYVSSVGSCAKPAGSSVRQLCETVRLRSTKSACSTVTAATTHLRSDVDAATQSGNDINLLLSHHSLKIEVKHSDSLGNMLHIRAQLRQRE